jgi:DNA-binding CsgD family transcriptional regulator
MGEQPFVGREREIAAVRASLEAGGTLVTGPAGVGKTRLVNEALKTLDPERYEVRRAYGTHSAAAIPLGAFAALLPASALKIEDAVDELKATERRLVVAVDDAHLLDSASARVVEQLSHRRLAAIILTVRDGERPKPDIALERLDLAPLEATQTTQLLEKMAGTVDAATAERVWRASGGNPLLVRELVANGALTQTMSARLTDLIRTQMGALTRDERTALEVLALAEPIGVDALRSYASVETLETRGLVRIRQDGRRTGVWLGHPLYGELVRAELPRLRANRLRRELADQLEKSGARRSGDTLRLAVWLLDSGAPAPVEVFATAARQAYAASDLPLAQRLAQRALTDHAAVATLADSLLFDLRAEEAEQLLADLWPALDAGQRVALTHTRGFNLQVGLARPADALVLVREAEPLATDPDTKFQLASLKFGVAYMTGDYRKAVELAQPLLSNVDTSPEYALMQNAYADALAATGKPLQALETIASYEKRAPVESEQLPAAPSLAICRSRTQLRLGQPIEAGRTARHALDRWPGWDFGTIAFSALAAAASRHTGAIADAGEVLAPALEVIRTATPWEAHLACLAEAAHAAALAGNAELATKTLEEGDERALPGWRGAARWLELARPWVAAAGGDASRAVELALRTAADTPAVFFELEALHSVVRLGEPRSALPRLDELTVEGPCADLYRAHAHALVANDPTALVAVSEDFSAYGMGLYAAEAMGQAARLDNKYQPKAAELAARCQGARTPALLLAAVPALTRRELDVARLAADGLSNQQIADRLALSRRTVENHLGAAYQKLGGGRAELANRLAGISLGP